MRDHLVKEPWRAAGERQGGKSKQDNKHIFFEDKLLYESDFDPYSHTQSDCPQLGYCSAANIAFLHYEINAAIFYKKVYQVIFHTLISEKKLNIP